jgi:hypothetical protein
MAEQVLCKFMVKSDRITAGTVMGLFEKLVN